MTTDTIHKSRPITPGKVTGLLTGNRLFPGRNIKSRIILPDNSVGNLTATCVIPGNPGAPIYRFTHPKQPTCLIEGDDRIVERFGSTEAPNSPSNPIIRLVTSDDALIILTKDTRHGTTGWRACRYEDGIWDESYLFFETLFSAVIFASNPTESSRQAAHRRF